MFFTKMYKVMVENTANSQMFNIMSVAAKSRRQAKKRARMMFEDYLRNYYPGPIDKNFYKYSICKDRRL